jgi:hypothetical protein
MALIVEGQYATSLDQDKWVVSHNLQLSINTHFKLV